MKLIGKVALVTGSAHRVGKAVALALAQEGADIVVHYGGSADAARQTVAEIETMGRRTLLVRADMGNWNEATQLGQKALDYFGKVDILINSASSFINANYLETTESQYDAAMDVNTKGPYAVSQVIGKAMIAGDGGNIINIIDEGAFYPSKSYTAHSISKAALLALTRSQTLALGPKVRVNAICPGPILKPPTYTDEQWENLRRSNPLNALGTAEQVGEIVMFFLTGPQFINGDCIMLEGGRMWKREF
jgi:NAD(P)-dependent dehydrogenase (short-subunit alcohol dehydrogenase family)